MSKTGVDMGKYVNSSKFFDYSQVTQPQNSTDYLSSIVIGEHPAPPKEYLITFSKEVENYCVGVVDMVNSTKISATIGPSRVSTYYQIFLNSMSRIVNKLGGVVIKNIGDCLLYYFPESNNLQSKDGFVSSLECALTMMDSHELICKKLKEVGLPCVDYRISLDYGSVFLMRSSVDPSLDMIGPPVNMCSKINRCAPKNGVVIGGDLHQIVKSFKEYSFSQVTGCHIGLKCTYPVYSLRRK